jgi:paraquat-inducible protein B
MSKPVNKTMIGLFVVGAITLVVIAIAVLGSGKLFEKRYKYYMVFQGSVKGLNVGAPVVFRGVKIGSVSAIHMNFNYATKALNVLVYAEFEQAQVETTHIDEATAKLLKEQGQYAMIREFVARGLRAQLEMQSFVTGQLQVALDFYPDKPAVFTGIDKKVQEIPTIPTPLQQLAKKLENLPIDELFNNLNSAVKAITKLAEAPELKESIKDFDLALKDMQTLVRNVDAQVKPLGAGLSDTIRDARKLIKNADNQVASVGTNVNETLGEGRKFIRNIDGSVESIRANVQDTLTTATSALKQAEILIQELSASASQDSSLMYRVDEALGEVAKAARSLRTLTDYLERHPEALLSGKGEPGGK